MPKVKVAMKDDKFLNRYQYMNDTLCIGVGIELIGGAEFTHTAVKWNMKTGEIVPMHYENPQIEKRRIGVAASADHGIYVEVYHHHDLITICSLDGDLKYNIYGPKWDNLKSNKVLYFSKAVFVNDKIIISYCGESNLIDSENGLRGNLPTKLMIFDIKGHYLRTLETGYPICDFCYDKENHRIILSMDADIQFGYLDME
jgi:hypothetical protein